MTLRALGPRAHHEDVRAYWPARAGRHSPGSALYRTLGEAGDEPVEEEVEHDRDRHGDENGGRLQRLPEEHVAAYQLGGYAGGQHLLGGGRHERERVDELARREGEGEHDDRDDARERQGDDGTPERRQPAVAVHHRLLLDVS